jgi:AmmeMemoRadiSam system protein B/AmmeMemoRadiSam system protein A
MKAEYLAPQLVAGSPYRDLLWAIFFQCIFAVVLVSSCAKKTPAQQEGTGQNKTQESAEPAKNLVLRSSLAGAWYSADPQALTAQLDDLFKKADTNAVDNVIALILPHAGYQWSGQTAAVGLKTTDKKYKRIIVIGPSHHTYLEDVFSAPKAAHYETPLGRIPLDVEFIDKLLKFPVFQNLPHALEYENSIEMELPLLQYRCKDFKLVPIVAGQCSWEAVKKAGDILKSLVGADTLVVASSDFVHYGSQHQYVPFTENIPERLKQLDMGAYEYIAKLDSEGFLQYRRKTGATICGAVPIAVLLSMLSQPSQAHLVRYTTSGELTGDFSNSVSYLAVAFSGKWANYPEIEPDKDNPELSEQDKKQLLILARQSILYALQNRRFPQPSELGATISDAMSRPRAAFVTLKKHSQLRGCIGDVFAQRPLHKSVIANAIRAGFSDTRFPPLTQEECKDITIEISALTTPHPIDSPDKIRLGVDGIVLNKDGRSALYLPQVAPEQNWDLNQTLTNLSLKAGLPPDAWKEGAAFLVFQAVVFGEDK